MPGFGACAITRPRSDRLERARLTLPTAHCRRRIFGFAALRRSPTTFGTTQVGTLAKPAVTERFAVIVSTQPPRPEQAPDQPVNSEPEAGVSVRVTAVPLLNGAEQVAPQLIPAGEL